ncbi:hypothetical protein GCM10011425_15190 [Mucilaginibacter galii]|uniref:Uncharacterized protein n=2 Tax=Mucilaginibacter galii TaxID=2005073 RepID=A0A917J8W8_9SPHI|nr:hypothetical protein GCM10011425_15190 [Mucilaginibacter galii]
MTSEEQLNSPEVSAARSWYESTYPQKTGGNFTTLSTTTTSDPVDLTQRIRPDWPKGLSYHRLNNDVVEIPIDASSKFSYSLTMGDDRSRTVYNKAYSRSSFLLFKKGSGYEAFIMIIIADSSYIKNDPGKLANNTYRKHDADFSGVVIYSTPKGKFICSYGYKSGQLLPYGKPAPDNALKEASVNGSSHETQEIERDPLTVTCTYYYVDHYINDVFVNREFLYRECITSGSDGSGGTGGTSPTTTPECPPITGTGMAAKYQVLGGRDPIGEPPPPDPGDGGFPPPVTTNSNCIVKVADTTRVDTTQAFKDPCLEKLKLAANAQNATIASQNNALLQKALASEPFEYGTEHNLTSWPNGSYMNLPLRTNNLPNSYTSRFTWDSVNGYTLGFTHYHPRGTAFSPGDVYTMVKSLTSSTLQAAGSAAVKYYKDNATII